MFKFKNKKGFTLVDFLIIVVILGILAVVVIPKFLVRPIVCPPSCQGIMAVMNAAIEEWMFINSKAKIPSLTTVMNDTGRFRFPDGPPKCPGGGIYTLGTDNRVRCSIHGQVDSKH